MIAPMDVDLKDVLRRATLEEVASLLAGQSTWRTAAIDRLGVPELKVSDGPSGARGEIFGEGVPAAFLPSGVSLGATWDVDLMREMGELLAEETKSKASSVILAPTICIHRHPLGGRNFESFSEDPFLTGKLATAHVNGVQSRGIGATPKHFIANEQETDRFHVNAIIQPRPMREVYLLPFQMVVRDADPWCMMTAYNKVNGHHCDSSRELLDDIARKEWGWEGLFMSDWGGTTSCENSISAGLDLEMPGPPAHRTAENILRAITEGKVDKERVMQLAHRVLRLVHRAGRFTDSTSGPEICLDSPETPRKLLHAAASGIVMLKNDRDALPLKDLHRGKVAVVGPNAKRIVAGGGGSSYIKAPYWTSVHDSLETRLSERQVQVMHTTGAKVNRYLPVASPSVVRDPINNQPGAVLEWFNTTDRTGDIIATQHIDDVSYISFGNFPEAIDRETGFSFRLRLVLRPSSTGSHRMSLASIGPSKLFVDDKLLASESGSIHERGSLFFTYGSNETIVKIDMIQGQDYHVKIDYSSHDRQLDPNNHSIMLPMEDKFQGVRFGFAEFNDADLPREATEVARDCDAAVVVVGRDKEWELESQDIPIFELPGEQVRLIEEVAATNSRTIVVIQAGTPVQMEPWIHKVSAVLYCWYQGQELGNAAASIICGEFNPSGRLPITFPERLEDCPAYSSFPGEAGQSYYSEGLLVGYKWWDWHNITPLFPIGYGLSYSKFEIYDSKLKNTALQPDKNIEVSGRVRNVGGSQLAGRETVILWHSLTSRQRLQRPKKQICGFAKTPLLKSGESCEIVISVDKYAFGMWDTIRNSWVIDRASRFDLLLGTNASSTFCVGSLDVSEEITWIH